MDELDSTYPPQFAVDHSGEPTMVNLGREDLHHAPGSG